MKRSKQVATMIDVYNLYLKNNHVTDWKEIILFTNLLIKAKVYKGYNMFYMNDKNIQCPCSSYDDKFIQEHAGFLQIY